MLFENFGLDPLLCRALSETGYQQPTPVQELAIPAVLSGRDVLASADTGTGKTAAFMLPALHRLAKPTTGPGKGPRVLILTPTRELASQVSKAAETYGKYLKRIRTVSILGGMPYEPQRKDLRHYVDILVATPGRLLDHYREGRIDLGRIEMLILDEADRMLDMGFLQDVRIVAEAIKTDHQTIMFSATIGKGIISAAKSLTKDALRVEIPGSETTNDNVKQYAVATDSESHKRDIVKAVLNEDNIGQMLVFTATKRGADELAEKLSRDGIAAVALHGDMRQNVRTRTLAKIRANKFRVLVATDVAARGLDIRNINRVINFDVPRTSEDYTHRIGRTGRAGESGSAYTLVSRTDRTKFLFVEKRLGHVVEIATIVGHGAKVDFLKVRPTGNDRQMDFTKRSGGANKRFGKGPSRGNFRRGRDHGGRSPAPNHRRSEERSSRSW